MPLGEEDTGRGPSLCASRSPGLSPGVGSGRRAQGMAAALRGVKPEGIPGDRGSGNPAQGHTQGHGAGGGELSPGTAQPCSRSVSPRNACSETPVPATAQTGPFPAPASGKAAFPLRVGGTSSGFYLGKAVGAKAALVQQHEGGSCKPWALKDPNLSSKEREKMHI